MLFTGDVVCFTISTGYAIDHVHPPLEARLVVRTGYRCLKRVTDIRGESANTRLQLSWFSVTFFPASVPSPFFISFASQPEDHRTRRRSSPRVICSGLSWATSTNYFTIREPSKMEKTGIEWMTNRKLEAGFNVTEEGGSKERRSQYNDLLVP
ncbi:hypothetical protein TCAL_15275, partial [Tigriopus californicus]